MQLTQCDLCKKTIEGGDINHGTFVVPPKKGKGVEHLAERYKIDVCDDCLDSFLDKFAEFMRGLEGTGNYYTGLVR